MKEELRQAVLRVFDKLQRNSIHLNYYSAGEPVEMGRSRLGGKPDLPGNFVWPYYAGEGYGIEAANRPLSFLGQINLAETAAFDKERLLPETGLLSFFYEVETQKWGFDPEDRGCARVYYFEDTADLHPTDFPQDLREEFRVPEFSVSMEAAASVPFEILETPEGAAFSAEFPAEVNASGWWDEYGELWEKFNYPMDGSGTWDTKLLGWPDLMQAAMEQECEEVTRGYCHGGGSIVPSKLKEEVELASRDWRLLFQMGTVSDGKFELMFGDAGRIYFWIKKQDLAARYFEKVWLILQC